jgi:hypothetical protein
MENLKMIRKVKKVSQNRQLQQQQEHQENLLSYLDDSIFTAASTTGRILFKFNQNHLKVDFNFNRLFFSTI